MLTATHSMALGLGFHLPLSPLAAGGSSPYCSQGHQASESKAPEPPADI